VGVLAAAGIAIIVADIAKDVASLGVLTVESPMSFALAMRLFYQAAVVAP
jgi:hypothetical protein